MYEWEKSFVERWGACIFRETLTVRARLRVVSTSLSEHEMISRKVRSQSTLNQLEPPPLQDIIYMIDPKQQAVIFEQTYNLPDNRSSESIRLLDQIGNDTASTLLSKLSGKNRKSKISTISASHKKRLKEKFQRNKDKNNNNDSTSSSKISSTNSPDSALSSSSSSMLVKPIKSKTKTKTKKKLFSFRPRSNENKKFVPTKFMFVLLFCFFCNQSSIHCGSQTEG